MVSIAFAMKFSMSECPLAPLRAESFRMLSKFLLAIFLLGLHLGLALLFVLSLTARSGGSKCKDILLAAVISDLFSYRCRSGRTWHRSRSAHSHSHSVSTNLPPHWLGVLTQRADCTSTFATANRLPA